jgi:hypothetical protein
MSRGEFLPNPRFDSIAGPFRDTATPGFAGERQTLRRGVLAFFSMSGYSQQGVRTNEALPKHREDLVSPDRGYLEKTRRLDLGSGPAPVLPSRPAPQVGYVLFYQGNRRNFLGNRRCLATSRRNGIKVCYDESR